MLITYINILLSENCEVNMKRYSQNQHKLPKPLKIEQKINNVLIRQQGNNQETVIKKRGQCELPSVVMISVL